MVPVLGREIEEGKHSFAIFSQAGDRLLVLGAVFVGEHIDRGFSGRAGRHAVNRSKVCLHVYLDRKSDLVEHVGGLVNPTPLVPCAGKDLIDSLPEAERAVTDREIRRDLEPTPLDVDEKLAPALRALPYPGLEPNEFLLAFGVWRRSARACIRQHLPFALAGRPHPPTRTRIVALTGHASARHQNRPATPPSRGSPVRRFDRGGELLPTLRTLFQIHVLGPRNHLTDFTATGAIRS